MLPLSLDLTFLNLDRSSGCLRFVWTSFPPSLDILVWWCHFLLIRFALVISESWQPLSCWQLRSLGPDSSPDKFLSILPSLPYSLRCCAPSVPTFFSSLLYSLPDSLQLSTPHHISTVFTSLLSWHPGAAAPVAQTRFPTLTPGATLPEKTQGFIQFLPSKHHLNWRSTSNAICNRCKANTSTKAANMHMKQPLQQCRRVRGHPGAEPHPSHQRCSPHRCREPLCRRKHRVSCDFYPPNITWTQRFHFDLQSLPCKSQ